MANMLTTKEAELVSELLAYEETACKKARLYSRSLIEPTLSKTFTKLAENHQRRFNALFDML